MLLLAELRFVISRCQKQQEIAASTVTWDAVTTVTKDKFSGFWGQNKYIYGPTQGSGCGYISV